MTSFQKKDSILYVLMTFLVSWVSWGALIVFNLPAKSTWYSMTLYLLGGFATAIIALLLPLCRGKQARREYFGRFFRFRIPLSQYILPLVSALAIYSVSFLLVLLLNRNAALSLTLQPAYMILPLFASMVFGGGVEEFGWRGVIVGNLKKRNPVWVALGVGCVWALWHMPLFFIQGVSQYQADFPAFFIGVIGYSFVLTAIYKKTQSVIPCIIFHAMLNALGGLGFIYTNDQALAVWIDGLAKLAVGVVAYCIIGLTARKSTPVQTQVQD